MRETIHELPSPLDIFNKSPYYYSKSTQMPLTNNPELKAIAEADQHDRLLYTCRKMTMQELHKRDRKNVLRVLELVHLKEVKTVKDYLNAAIVFQHGRNAQGERDAQFSGLAIKMMQKAVEIDPNTNKWLLAAAIDRDLMIKGKPQIYGTQYLQKEEYGPWELYELDSSQISDEERVEYRVVELAGQADKLKNMNLSGLIELHLADKSIKEIVEFCESNNPEKSNYNYSEKGILRFGTQLMKLGKMEDALEVFKLNTRLYPEECDTFHSLGDCLKHMGRTEEAIAAFQQSLAVNPEYGEAIRDLAEIMDS